MRGGGYSTVIALQGNGIDRKIENGCNGKGFRENEMYTLDVVDRHAVVYEPKTAMEQDQDKSDVKNALRASASKSSHADVDPSPMAFHLQQDPISGEISPCIGGQGQSSVGVFMGGQGAKARGIAYSESVAPTLKSVMSGGNTIPDVVCAAPALSAYGVDCRNGVLDKEKVATLQAHVDGGYSLNSTHPILYPAEGANEDL